VLYQAGVLPNSLTSGGHPAVDLLLSFDIFLLALYMSMPRWWDLGQNAIKVPDVITVVISSLALLTIIQCGGRQIDLRYCVM
jgi:hypothetical protein